MTMQQITAALDAIGPMSAHELCVHLGISRLATNKQIKQLRDKKAIHIAHHERQPDGVQGRCIPMYAQGDAPDAAAPGMRSKRDTNQRYHKRHSAIISARRYPVQRSALGVWAGLA